MSEKIVLECDLEVGFGRVQFSSPKADEISIAKFDPVYVNDPTAFDLILGDVVIEGLSEKQLKIIKKEIKRTLDGLD